MSGGAPILRLYRVCVCVYAMAIMGDAGGVSDRTSLSVVSKEVIILFSALCVSIYATRLLLFLILVVTTFCMVSCYRKKRSVTQYRLGISGQHIKDVVFLIFKGFFYAWKVFH